MFQSIPDDPMGLGLVTSFEGFVESCNLLTPHSSFYEDNDYYQIILTFPTKEQTDAIADVFRASESPDYQHENVWRVDDYTVRFNTLHQIRLDRTEEFEPGSYVHVRAKPDLMQGSESVVERMLIALVSEMPDLDSVELDEDDFTDDYYCF